MTNFRQPPWLPTLYHQDIPRYVNPHDSMVKAVERGRWYTLKDNKRLVYGETNLLGALVRYEPAFQHLDEYATAAPHYDLLGDTGIVLEGEWVQTDVPFVKSRVRPMSYDSDSEDYWFKRILWTKAGYIHKVEWLTKTVRVISLANGVEDGAG